MITLKNVLDLMPNAILDFGLDSFIQATDYATGAHYRLSADGELMLGGNPVLCSITEFMKLPVRYIEFIDDQCVIGI